MLGNKRYMMLAMKQEKTNMLLIVVIYGVIFLIDNEHFYEIKAE